MFVSGAVLEQDFLDERHLIAFLSKNSSTEEQNYPSLNLEIPGNVHAVSPWRYYLHGFKFVVETDHGPLKMFLTQAKLPPLQFFRLKELFLTFSSFSTYRASISQWPMGFLANQRNSWTNHDCTNELLTRIKDKIFHVHNLKTTSAGGKQKIPRQWLSPRFWLYAHIL